MTVSIISGGAQGPPGPAGQGYTTTHEQNEPLSVWHFNHNMNKWPSVVVVDQQGYVIDACVEYVDKSTVIIRFFEEGLPSPQRGKAFCN